MKIKSTFFLISLIVLGGVFLVTPKTASALTSVNAYYLLTYNTRPLLGGYIDEAGSSVTITIGGHAYAAEVSGLTWTFQLSSAMEYGTYDIEASATKGATTVASTTTGGLIIDSDFPFNVYSILSPLGELTSITFVTGQTFSLNGITLTISDNTAITRTGGGNYDLSEMIGDSVTTSNLLIAKEIRFGIPNIDLTFSHPISLAVDVGSSYNGQNLNIFTKSDSAGSGWDPMNINCTVSGGTCTFEVSHASYFAMSLYHSIAEGEEDYEDDEENQKAYIDSWKASQYEKPDTSCVERLKLEIKGKHFDKKAEVKIGDKKAFSVDRKSSKKIVAKFCMSDLSKVKTGSKRTVKVINPNADTEKADKKINLESIKYKYSESDFDYQTADGAKNIQKALSQLDFLDQEYITGFYGSITIEAIKKFQEQNGLPNTGYFGSLTKNKLIEKCGDL